MHTGKNQIDIYCDNSQSDWVNVTYFHSQKKKKA